MWGPRVMQNYSGAYKHWLTEEDGSMRLNFGLDFNECRRGSTGLKKPFIPHNHAPAKMA